jgi:hypothetical protein
MGNPPGFQNPGNGIKSGKKGSANIFTSPVTYNTILFFKNSVIAAPLRQEASTASHCGNLPQNSKKKGPAS